MSDDNAILTAIENLRSDVREDNEALRDNISKNNENLHHRMDSIMGNCATRHNGIDLKELKTDVNWLKNKYWLFFGGAAAIWTIAAILIGVLK